MCFEQAPVDRNSILRMFIGHFWTCLGFVFLLNQDCNSTLSISSKTDIFHGFNIEENDFIEEDSFQVIEALYVSLESCTLQKYNA